MLEQPTEASPFLSRFGGGYLSPNKYLAETMCVRIAKSKGKTLGERFWDEPSWKRVFLTQLRFANSLLKMHNFEEIREALNSEQGRKAWSLGAKWLDPLIEEARRKLEAKAAIQREKPPEPEAPRVELPLEAPRPSYTRPSPLTKLREL